MSKQTDEQKYGSDLLVDALVHNKIDYIAFNPGSSVGGMLDSLVNYKVDKKPELILCFHEEIAVAIAHGYAKASGKYMAVAIHANVGLMHASMAIFNAWCDRVPILVLGGTAPLDPEKRRPWIDWIHSSNVQGNVVKDYVKWHDQPYGVMSAINSIYRACKIMGTDPAAPVYLSISSTIQNEKLDKKITLKDIDKYSPPATPSANISDLKKLADLLVKAKFPLIIVDYMGRNPEAVKNLVVLTERIGIAVIDICGRYNFPTSHPLCLTGAGREVVEKADLILALDVQDLCNVLGEQNKKTGEYESYLNDGCKVVHISMNDYLISNWAADYQKLYPLDLNIAADSSLALSQLYGLCEEILTQERKENCKHRYKLIEKEHNLFRSSWASEAKVAGKFLTVSSALNQIWKIVKNESFVLTNCGGLTVRAWVKKIWEFDGNNSVFIGINSGGAGLGYGLGASIGAALAYKDTGKICINIQNDGDALFTPSALWTAAHYEIPLLIIVMNNRSYGLIKSFSEMTARNRNRSTENSNVGAAIDSPCVDFPSLARSLGMHAFDTVKNADELIITIRKAINMLKDKQQSVLVDVLLES